MPTQLLDFNPFAPPFVASAALVVGLTVLLFRQRHRWPGWFALWLSYLALLVPVLGLTEHPHFPSDRYSLVVGLGWALVLGRALCQVWPRRPARQTLLTAVALLLLALGLLSYRQTFLWQTGPGFFYQLLVQLDDNPKFLPQRLALELRLAQAYRERHKLADAAATLLTALRLEPDLAAAHQLLGQTLLEAGDLDGAKSSLHEAARLDPAYVSWLNDLGAAYATGGNLQSAMAEFAEALRQRSDNTSALENMAHALTLSGRTNEAELYQARLKALPAREPGR
jgi:tetratricopeptide (TPR) repeat protein